MMKKLTPSRLSSARVAAILTGSIVAFSPANAATFTWGNTTGNWTVPANWVGGVAPSGTGIDDIYVFGGSAATGYVSTHDDAFPYELNQLTLNSTATVPNTITGAPGSSLSFIANSLAATPRIAQNGTGEFVINLPLILQNGLDLIAAPGAGRVTLNGAIEGFDFTPVAVTGGSWRFGGTSSTWSSGAVITGGAVAEVRPQPLDGGGSVNAVLSGTGSGFGNGGDITLDNGTLRMTPVETGSINLGTNRTIVFGESGGLFEMVNTTGGNISGGSLSISTTSGATAPGIIRFNGGTNGLMENSATNGNWNAGANALRFSSMFGDGPLRVELSNGAAMRLGAGATNTVDAAMTIRGVLGGNPISDDGMRNSAIARDVGRVVVDGFTSVNYMNGLILENALQFHAANGTRAIDGNITIAGIASGNPGNVAFSGRSTGTQLQPTLYEPGAPNEPGQHVLWLGRDGDDTLTIQDGGTAVLDSRMRYEQGNHNGVLLNATANIEAGGTLRFYQSLSNASGSVVANRQGQTGVVTNANVGNHIVQGDLVGSGTTARESVVDLHLPVGNVIPAFVPPATTIPGNTLPYGGVFFENSSDLVVNGTGFGGLRINGLSRANALFTNNAPDPVPNSTKLNNLLTPARIAAVTGTGGYLSVGAGNETYTFPNAEWAPGVAVGLKVVNSNLTGADLTFDAAKASWAHNLAVDAGAQLDLGTQPFSLTAGTLHGSGAVTGDGVLTIATGASISGGLGDTGTLTLGNLTLNGTLIARTTSIGDSNLVYVTGNLVLGGSSVLQIAPGSAFDAGRYTLLTYAGERTGTFATTLGVPVGASLNYDLPSRVRLVFGTIATRIWNGAPGAVWSTAAGNANWQGGQSYADGDQVIFNDTATGSTTVNITGSVAPDFVTVNNTTKAYIINGSAGNSITGAGALTKQGTNSLEMRGSHTYLGGTMIEAGTLRIGNDNALPDTGEVNLASGATLDLAGRTDTIGTLVAGGTVTAGSLTTSGVTLTGAAAIAANLTLAGDVSHTTETSATITGTVNLGGAARTLDVVEAGGTLTVSNVISNGGLTKSGDGTLRLTAANTYAGGTIVNGGTVDATVSQAIPNGALHIAAGATVQMNDFDYTATSLTGAGTLDMGVADLTLNPTTSAAFNGPITGVGAVTKIGTGVQTLGGTNTFVGTLSIQAGHVNLTAAGAAGQGSIEVASGAGIQLGAAIPNDVTLGSGATVSSLTNNPVATGFWQVDEPVTFLLSDRDSNANSDIVFNGALVGDGDITLTAGPNQPNADSGSGLRFRGALSSVDYTGTIIATAETKLEIQMGNSSANHPIPNATLRMTAGTSTGGLNGDYSQLQPRLNAADQTYILGNDVEISGTGYVNVNVLGAANVVGEFGKLTIGDGQILGASKNDRAIRTAAFQEVALTGGMAEFRAYDPAFGSQTNADRGGSNIILGVISETSPGSGFISKSNELWSVQVNGASTYTGPTDVQQGTLRVAAEGSIASSSEVRLGTGTTLDVSAHTEGYAIPAGQKLVGSGGWNGRLVMSGSLAPGPEIATLQGQNFTLQGTAIMQFQLSGVDNTSDKLTLTGSFDKGVGGAFQFDFEGGGLDGMTYSLVSFAGTTFSVSDFTYTDLGAGLAGTFNMTGTELTFSVVPEPGTAATLLLGAGLLGFRRRRARL